MENYFLTPPRNIVRIHPPITTVLQFESTFTVDEDTQKEFKKISEVREKALLAASRNYTATSISAISEYLPLLIGLVFDFSDTGLNLSIQTTSISCTYLLTRQMNAAETLPPDFSRYLRISWNSTLSPGFYRDNLYSHYNWYFEVINILLVCKIESR